MMILRKLTLAVFILQAFSSGAQHLHKEKYYQAAFADSLQGQTEVILDDRTRVDILTDSFAIEVDFAQKWAEGIGQALFYALKTNRHPGILLIMEQEKDVRFLKRLRLVTDLYGIRVWTVDSQLNFR